MGFGRCSGSIWKLVGAISVWTVNRATRYRRQCAATFI